MQIIINSVLTLFLLIFLGCLLGKKNIVSTDYASGLSNFIVKVTMPATVFNAMQMEYDPELLHRGVEILIFSLVFYAASMALGFIAFSTLMMVIVGNAAQLLIIAGAFNGLILPITLGVMLIASRSKRIVGSEYKHPMPLIILGAIVVLISLYSGVQAVPGILQLFG